jgi:hypothetical protein
MTNATSNYFNNETSHSVIPVTNTDSPEFERDAGENLIAESSDR